MRFDGKCKVCWYNYNSILVKVCRIIFDILGLEISVLYIVGKYFIIEYILVFKVYRNGIVFF